MLFSDINKSAIKEAKSGYFMNCNPSLFSNKDLLILILDPLLRERSLSVTADDILQHGLPYLTNLSEFELSTLFGLSEKQSFHLMAVFELARRIGGLKRDEIVVIRTPEDARDIVLDLKFLDKEHFVCIFLNTKNHVIGRETISVGTLNAALVHPREVFRAVIKRGAASIVIAHNHPSSDPSPSQEDIMMTRRLVKAGELLGIEVMDHIIIGGDDFVSLKNLDLMSGEVIE